MKVMGKRVIKITSVFVLISVVQLWQKCPYIIRALIWVDIVFKMQVMKKTIGTDNYDFFIKINCYNVHIRFLF